MIYYDKEGKELLDEMAQFIEDGCTYGLSDYNALKGKMLTALQQAMTPMPGWISVKERLPVGGTVWVVRNGIVTTAKRHPVVAFINVWSDHDGQRIGDEEITHWMPYCPPEPPKEESK